MYKLPQINLTQLIDGHIQWITDHANSGWTPYYVNLMFSPLNRQTERFPTIIAHMHHAIRATPPPGGNTTTTVIGRDGNSSACAMHGAAIAASAKAVRSRT